jgi:ATP-binding cassette subfamily F protein 1
VDHVSFRYDGGRPLFHDLSTAVTMSSRIAMVGANGSGKSTLFKMLTRDLAPLEGEVRHNARLKIGVFNQHFVENLPLDFSPVQHLEKLFPEEHPQASRKTLGMFGLPSHAHQIKMKALSGGQKARVLFSQIAMSKPDVIFLDEPTNHLDIESIDALVEAVKKFEGGVVMVTHDARLLVETECDLWICGGCDPKKRDATGEAAKKGGKKKDAGPARARIGDDPEPFSGAIRFEGDFMAFAAKTLSERDLGEV